MHLSFSVRICCICAFGLICAHLLYLSILRDFGEKFDFAWKSDTLEKLFDAIKHVDLTPHSVTTDVSITC